MAHNGPRIGDSGGLESLNFQFCTKLSNSLLLFSKFMKKGNIKGCCDKKGETFNLPLNRHFANTMLCDVFNYFTFDTILHSHTYIIISF